MGTVLGTPLRALKFGLSLLQRLLRALRAGCKAVFNNLTRPTTSQNEPESPKTKQKRRARKKRAKAAKLLKQLQTAQCQSAQHKLPADLLKEIIANGVDTKLVLVSAQAVNVEVATNVLQSSNAATADAAAADVVMVPLQAPKKNVSPTVVTVTASADTGSLERVSSSLKVVPFKSGGKGLKGKKTKFETVAWADAVCTSGMVSLLSKKKGRRQVPKPKSMGMTVLKFRKEGDKLKPRCTALTTKANMLRRSRNLQASDASHHALDAAAAKDAHTVNAGIASTINNARSPGSATKNAAKSAGVHEPQPEEKTTAETPKDLAKGPKSEEEKNQRTTTVASNNPWGKTTSMSTTMPTTMPMPMTVMRFPSRQATPKIWRNAKANRTSAFPSKAAARQPLTSYTDKMWRSAKARTANDENSRLPANFNL